MIFFVCQIKKMVPDKTTTVTQTFISFMSMKPQLTMQAESDVDGADVTDCLQVLDAGAL